MSLNKVILIGHVGDNPKISQTKDGRNIANFSLATSESWKDKNTGEKQTRTEWHRIVAFGSVVEVINNYIKKGSKLYIEGQLQTRKWTDKEGNDRYNTEIILQGFNSKLLMLNSKGHQDNTSKMSDHDSNVFNQLENEIPF